MEAFKYIYDSGLSLFSVVKETITQRLSYVHQKQVMTTSRRTDERRDPALSLVEGVLNLQAESDELVRPPPRDRRLTFIQKREHMRVDHQLHRAQMEVKRLTRKVVLHGGRVGTDRSD